jgi:hypothetical protein
VCNYEKVENMTTTNILSLLGGLALFLYGMQMMGNGLEAAAGDRLKQILEKLTSNRFLGGGYSKFECNNSYGRWICQRTDDDFTTSCMDYYGS